MIHQHFMLVPSQTVTENIILGLSDPRFFCRWTSWTSRFSPCRNNMA